MQHIEVKRHLTAPRDRVWAVFMDIPGWTQWAGVGRVSLERAGDANGVGAIRVFGGNGREEILSVTPGARMTYTVLSGIPVRDHLGEATFEDAGGGTDVVWRVRFESRIPGLGPLFRVAIGRIFHRILTRLDREAARRR